LEVAVDIAGIAGLFVSTAGLWFSVKAWRRAAAAEQAAKDAREAVRRGNAAEDLALLASLANELLACVQNEQIEAAALRGRDLVSGMNQTRKRWSTYFPSPEVDSRLEEIGRYVEKISKTLTIRKGQIAPTERDRLLDSCHKALRILSGEAGRMASHMESSASGR
jgi:hypothetical protein